LKPDCFDVAGGEGRGKRLSATVDVYDTERREWAVAQLSAPRKHMAAASTKNNVHAVFGGGQGSAGAAGQVSACLSRRLTRGHTCCRELSSQRKSLSLSPL
jgi:hypothetical protein